MNIIEATIKHAEANHDGFYLVLYLKSGIVIRGGVLTSSMNWVQIECPTEDGLITKFVSIDSIEVAEIEP